MGYFVNGSIHPARFTFLYFGSSVTFLSNHAGVEKVLDVSSSTVCRLIKPLLVSFPDGSVEHINTLIPGPNIDRIKGEYCLNKLREDSNLFDDKTGWKKKSMILAEEVENRFGLVFADRTIRKYINGLNTVNK